MASLVYCIFRDSAPFPPEPPPGVRGSKIVVTTHSGLGAAVSQVDRDDLTPGVSSLQAYGKVVAVFHHHHTVIPMRYGCFCQDKSQVNQLLAAERGWFLSRLKELDGCVEMGIRALLPPAKATQDSDLMGGETADFSARDCIDRAKACPQPGAAYLGARLGHYTDMQRRNSIGANMADRCQRALSGLFEKCVSEGPSPLGRPDEAANLLLSLYFLVPKKKIAAFRRAFVLFHQQETAKLLLTGPWAPYNFAAEGPGPAPPQLRS